MLIKVIDKIISPIAMFLEYNYMQPLGINNSRKFALAHNRLKYGRYQEYRKNRYLRDFDELTRENGLPVSPPNELKDGWALDTTQTLPHLKQLLADSEEIIMERGGVKRDSGLRGRRPFFQDIMTDDLLEKYPSILDFATSSDVLSVISKHLGFIPVLSSALPNGVRFNESDRKFDDTPDAPPRATQLFHLDYHDPHMAYAIVLLRDTTMEHGPFCFLPASVSQKAYEALNYWSIGRPFRVTDDEMYAVVSESELKKLCYPAGTVLFIDPGRCFHYGSRNALKTRYVMMYAYLSVCRSDFSDFLKNQCKYPTRDSDSRLRKMVLSREFMY